MLPVLEHEACRNASRSFNIGNKSHEKSSLSCFSAFGTIYQLFYLTIFSSRTVCRRLLLDMAYLVKCRILIFLLSVPRETKGASICHDIPNLRVGSYSYLQIIRFPLPSSTLPLLESAVCTISLWQANPPVDTKLFGTVCLQASSAYLCSHAPPSKF